MLYDIDWFLTYLLFLPFIFIIVFTAIYYNTNNGGITADEFMVGIGGVVVYPVLILAVLIILPFKFCKWLAQKIKEIESDRGV